MSPLTRRQFAQLVALSGTLATGGCSRWEWSDPTTTPELLLGATPATPWERRVLNRLSFGPRPGDLAALREQGIDAYISQQLTPETIPENPELESLLAECTTLAMSPDEAHVVETEWQYDHVVAPACYALFKFPRVVPPQEVQTAANELARATVLRALYSRRQLFELMVEFWSDHFNIDQSKADCRWLKTIDDAAIRRHALGKFRDLLEVSAHSPAMLVYLDNATNKKFDPATGTPPNENYARELLELHTLGDTSAYTLGDIQEVARCFTGWSVTGDWQLNPGRFIFRQADHDDDEKIVLGQKIPAGGGERDGELVLDLVAAHPLTAKFVCQKLCRYFVGDAPPAELVDHLAGQFLSTDGDIPAVLSTLFASDEFRTGNSRVIKRPLRFAISALRALGARSSGSGLAAQLQEMGQRPFGWAMPDGYPTSSEIWATGLMPRWKFAVDLAHGDLEETWIDLAGLQRQLSDSDPATVCQNLAQSLLGTTLDPETLAGLLALCEGDPKQALPQWLALMLMAPEFQWCA
jgi:uncharacterized protein (DUF1800 family)